MPAKTVNEHMDDCKNIRDVIDNANALLAKTKKELQIARAVIEELLDFQHPLLSIEAYIVKTVTGRDRSVAPQELMQAEIDRINALLGDRA